MGITGAGPHEGKRTCSNRCEMERGDKSFECQAKGCGKDQFCEGCAYIYTECKEDFCVNHIRDVAPMTEADAVYVCLVCLARIIVLPGSFCDFSSRSGAQIGDQIELTRAKASDGSLIYQCRRFSDAHLAVETPAPVQRPTEAQGVRMLAPQQQRVAAAPVYVPAQAQAPIATVHPLERVMTRCLLVGYRANQNAYLKLRRGLQDRRADLGGCPLHRDVVLHSAHEGRGPLMLLPAFANIPLRQPTAERLSVVERKKSAMEERAVEIRLRKKIDQANAILDRLEARSAEIAQLIKALQKRKALTAAKVERIEDAILTRMDEAGLKTVTGIRCSMFPAFGGSSGNF